MDSDEHSPDNLLDQQPSQFLKSLRELKELRSQLHDAADYCEKSFLRSTQKKKFLESTKGYVRNAVVTVVDHLGSVSANLNIVVSEKASGFAEVEFRIDSMKQRFLAYELYAQKIALNRTRWVPSFPKSQSHYWSTPEKSEHETSMADNKEKKKLGFEAEELPLFFYTYPHNASPANAKFSTVAVRDTIPVGGKGQKTPMFHLQLQQSSVQQLQQCSVQQQQQKKEHIRRPSGGRSISTGGDIRSLVRRSPKHTAISKG